MSDERQARIIHETAARWRLCRSAVRNGFAFPSAMLFSGEAAPRQFVQGAAFDNKRAITGKPKAFRTAGRQSRFVHE
jgi:hypothetical protein